MQVPSRRVESVLTCDDDSAILEGHLLVNAARIIIPTCGRKSRDNVSTTCGSYVGHLPLSTIAGWSLTRTGIDRYWRLPNSSHRVQLRLFGLHNRCRQNFGRNASHDVNGQLRSGSGLPTSSAASASREPARWAGVVAGGSGHDRRTHAADAGSLPECQGPASAGS